MYADLNNLSEIKMRLTYITLDDYKTKHLYLTQSYEELKEFFLDSISKYIEWQRVLDDAAMVKMDSLKNIGF